MGLVKKSTYIAIFATGIYCLKQYLNGGICTSQARIDDKVVVITGANTGIGIETAKDLVRRGAKVYLACRSLERAQRAAQDIQKETGASADRLPVIQLDLASLKSVRDFAKEFRKSHFLLTHLLMDALSTAPKSRIINVSSRAYERGTINFNDLMSEKDYNSLQAYCQSKLANVLFTKELAKRLSGTGITVYALHPGLVRTELGRCVVPYFDTTIGYNLFHYLTWPLMKEPWNGAQTTVCCAVDESLANESGKYYSDCKETEPTKEAQDDEIARKLWDISAKLVKLDPSETHSKLK